MDTSDSTPAQGTFDRVEFAAELDAAATNLDVGTTPSTYVVRDYRMGETKYLEHTPQTAVIHGLENVGDTTLRLVTVELLD